MQKIMLFIILASTTCTEALPLKLEIYQIPSKYWKGDRTRDLPVTGDIISSSIWQDSNMQLLLCVMQASRMWQKQLPGRNDCLVFQKGAPTPCFIGTLNAQPCENPQRLTFSDSSMSPGSVKVWLPTNTNRQADCVVIQHRVSGTVNFYQRTWIEYVNGFGEGPSRNFWIGLEQIYSLTNPNPRTLHMEMTLWNDTVYWVSYSTFQVGPASGFYKLVSLGVFTPSSGQLGNAMVGSVGVGFSTYDADHDLYSDSCSILFKAGWWFSSCHQTNPNGLYFSQPEALQNSAFAVGITWSLPFGQSYSMKEFKMLLW